MAQACFCLRYGQMNCYLPATFGDSIKGFDLRLSKHALPDHYGQQEDAWKDGSHGHIVQ
jgi:hypothetical protein